MKTYWTEPEQLDTKTWITRKMEGDKKVGESSFKSKQDTWDYLRTINIYIDDKLVHSSY